MNHPAHLDLELKPEHFASLWKSAVDYPYPVIPIDEEKDGMDFFEWYEHFKDNDWMSRPFEEWKHHLRWSEERMEALGDGAMLDWAKSLPNVTIAELTVFYGVFVFGCTCSLLLPYTVKFMGGGTHSWNDLRTLLSNPWAHALGTRVCYMGAAEGLPFAEEAAAKETDSQSKQEARLKMARQCWDVAVIPPPPRHFHVSSVVKDKQRIQQLGALVEYFAHQLQQIYTQEAQELPIGKAPIKGKFFLDWHGILQSSLIHAIPEMGETTREVTDKGKPKKTLLSTLKSLEITRVQEIPLDALNVSPEIQTTGTIDIERILETGIMPPACYDITGNVSYSRNFDGKSPLIETQARAIVLFYEGHWFWLACRVGEKDKTRVFTAGFRCFDEAQARLLFEDSLPRPANSK